MVNECAQVYLFLLSSMSVARNNISYVLISILPCVLFIWLSKKPIPKKQKR